MFLFLFFFHLSDTKIGMEGTLVKIVLETQVCVGHFFLLYSNWSFLENKNEFF